MAAPTPQTQRRRAAWPRQSTGARDPSSSSVVGNPERVHSSQWGSTRAAAAGFRIHTAERKCDLRIALAQDDQEPRAADVGELLLGLRSGRRRGKRQATPQAR